MQILLYLPEQAIRRSGGLSNSKSNQNPMQLTAIPARPLHLIFLLLVEELDPAIRWSDGDYKLPCKQYSFISPCLPLRV